MKDKVPISGIGDYSRKMLDKVMRAVVLEADSLVKQGSPVDTGRFAVSWQIGENSNQGTPAKPAKYGEPGVGTVVAGPQGSNYIPGKEKAGNSYFIHNNLPYAERLCYQGWSDKVDENWFEMVAKEMSELAPQFAKDIFKKPL
jgi:hypothetical protein